MKRILILALLPILFLGFFSCKDSLGYDPKVSITKIDNGGTITNPNDTDSQSKIFEIDSIKTEFKEIFRMAGFEPVNWKGRLRSKTIKLDTSKSDYKIALAIEMEGIAKDQEYLNKSINERVSFINLNLEDILDDPIYYMDDLHKNKHWFELTIRYISQNSSITLNGSQVRANLILLEIDKERGIIAFNVNVDIPPAMMSTRLARLNGKITLFYKKH